MTSAHRWPDFKINWFVAWVTRCSTCKKHGLINERCYLVDTMALLLFRKMVDCFHCSCRLKYISSLKMYAHMPKNIYTTFPIMQRIVSISSHLLISLFFIDAKLSWSTMFKLSKQHCWKYNISKHLPELISCLICKIPNIMERNFYFSINIVLLSPSWPIDHK